MIKVYGLLDVVAVGWLEGSQIDGLAAGWLRWVKDYSW